MNKFATFLKISLLDPLIRSFFRFTDAIVWSVVLVVLSILNLELNVGSFPLGDIVRVAWLMLPYLIFKTLLLERIKMPSYWKYLMTLVVVGLAVAYYFLKDLNPNEGIEMMRLATLWVIGILAALIVSYFPKRANLPTYIVYLASKFFATVFYSAVLYGGLTAVFASIEALFSVTMPIYFYIEMFFCILGLVAVPVGLGFIPEMTRDMGLEQYNKIWKTVFSLIVLPIVTVFSFILVVYVVTSTFNSNYYPYVYMVASLGTAVVGLITLFVLEPFKNDSPHIHLFSRWWPFVMLAILVGFYVEWIRSAIENGFSLDTSIYLFGSIWAVVCIVLYLIKKFPFGMQTGQTFASALVATMVIGMFVPYVNVVSLTTISLNRRFEEMLGDYGMLENGEIVYPDAALTAAQEIKLSNLVVSFSQVGYDRITLLPEGFGFTDFEAVFGFPPDVNTGNPEFMEISYDTGTFNDLSGILAEGYDQLIYFETYADHHLSTEGYTLVGDQEGTTWQITITDPLTAVSLPIAEITQGFYETLGVSTKTDLTLYDLGYQGVATDATYTLYFKYISAVYVSSTASVNVNAFAAYLGVTFA